MSCVCVFLGRCNQVYEVAEFHTRKSQTRCCNDCKTWNDQAAKEALAIASAAGDISVRRSERRRLETDATT